MDKDILIQVLIAQRNTALDTLAAIQAQLIALQRQVENANKPTD